MQRDIAANGSKTYRRYASAHLIFIDVEQRVRSVPRAPARGTATSHAAYGMRLAARWPIACACVLQVRCARGGLAQFQSQSQYQSQSQPQQLQLPHPLNAHLTHIQEMAKENQQKKILSQNDCDTIATTSAYSQKLEN